MGQLLFQYLDLLRSNKEQRLLFGRGTIEDIRYDQGHIQGLIDVTNLCNTLETYRLPTEEEKKKLAEKRNPKQPSQAEIMGQV